MAPDLAPGGVKDRSGAPGGGIVGDQIVPVIAAAPEDAEIHAVAGFGGGESMRAGERASLVLGEGAERKFKKIETAAGNPVEEITLVAPRIGAAAKAGPSLCALDPRVVARGEMAHAEGSLDEIPDLAEFQKGVAADTRVGRPPAQILLAKGAENDLVEGLAHIEDVMRHAQGAGGAGAQLRGIAARTLLWRGGLHSDAEHTPSGLAQQERSHAAIHPAAHQNAN